MNWLDVVLAVLVLWSVVTAFRKGISRELVGLASIVAALFLGAWFYGSVGYYLLPYVNSRPVANMAGFFVVFAGVWLVGGLVGQVMKRMMKTVGLGFFDRLLGAGFGFARGILLAIAVVMAIMAFAPGRRAPQAVVHSRLAPYVIDSARVCAAMAPYELKQGFRNSYDEIRSIWDQTLRTGMRVLPSKSKETKE